MNKTIYALGFFDGVHLGHQALLRACRELAQAENAQAGAATFTAHPDTLVLRSTPGLINTPEDRIRLLTGFGIHRVECLPFDDAMRCLPWEDFLEKMRREYDAAGFVCGADFRFGFRGAGNAEKLRTACQRWGIPCAVVPEQTVDDVRISSTYIRGLLERGDMQSAVRFLGHPHILTGTVVHGKQLGRRLGAPTANLQLPRGLAIPRFGVYACRVELEGKTYPAVTNIGVRPTVSGVGITVEPWILDYEGDLYDREITLEFFDFLRPERKFSGLEELQEEIGHNAQQTRELFDTWPFK